MSSSNPAVSVVLPTYNRANSLKRSINSVLNQTYTDFELIVVDDDSTDDTRLIVNQIDDDRVRLIEHNTNRGAPAARNTGIEAARGDFIAFQDSDDEWDEEKLKKQISVFDDVSSEVGVVYTRFCRLSLDGTHRTCIPKDAIGPKEGDLSDLLLCQNIITTQAAVVRRECFETVGNFDENLPRFQDWELWIRVAEKYEFKIVDEELVTAYTQPDSIIEDTEAMVEARERIVNKHRAKYTDKALADQLFRLGHSSLKTYQTRRGRAHLLRAVRSHPKVIYVVVFLVSLLGSHVYNALFQIHRQTVRRMISR